MIEDTVSNIEEKIRAADSIKDDRKREAAHIITYAPADIRWWNGQIRNSGSERALLDEREYPIIYPREG